MISPEVLRRYSYFANISDESLKQLAMMAEEKRVPAGTVMFREGDTAAHLSIILAGEIDIQYELGSGEMRTVDVLTAGDILGWSALIEPYRYTAIATATQDVVLARIDGPQLRALCEADAQLGYRLVVQVAKLLGHRLEGARIQLAAAD
jgi:CRP-like cAMP-binding protein